MSADTSGALGRAGRLSCFCPPGVPVENAKGGGAGLLAVGFSLAVLSQTLLLGVLPLAGMLLAPEPRWATLPYVAMLCGAAVATFPASLLLDSFGRRASFALGASHGVAGGFVMAWALYAHAFAPFCLGAFWVGVAQGFGLFYRHEAAIGAGSRGKIVAAAQVFGAGALAGVVGPTFAAYAQDWTPSSPHLGVVLAAALVQVAVLTLAMASSSRAPLRTQAPAAGKAALTDALAPTVLACAAWFGMTALMLSAPSAMIGCGIAAASVFGALSWHVIAMYAPSFVVEALARRVGVRMVALGGLAVILGAKLVFGYASTAVDFTLLLVAIAVGWSLTTTAATAWLHQARSPDRLVLAAHDLCLFVAAIGGALTAGNFIR